MRAAVVIMALSLAPVIALPQSLGDAARKQAHERSSQPPPPKVYAEADLHRTGDTARAPADLPASSTRADAHAKSASGRGTDWPGRPSHGLRRRSTVVTLSAAPALSAHPGADPRRHAPGFWPRKTS